MQMGAAEHSTGKKGTGQAQADAYVVRPECVARVWKPWQRSALLSPRGASSPISGHGHRNTDHVILPGEGANSRNADVTAGGWKDQVEGPRSVMGANLRCRERTLQQCSVRSGAHIS